MGRQESYRIVPFVGALPARFGMTRAEVARVVPRPLLRTLQREGWLIQQHEGGLFTWFDAHGRLARVGFSPEQRRVFLGRKQLLGPRLRKSPYRYLRTLEQGRRDAEWDIVAFPGLGLSLYSFISYDRAHAALHVLSREALPEELPRGRGRRPK